MQLSKEQIFSVKDYDLKEVEVPEWGGSVFVKPTPAGVKYRLQKEQTADPKTFDKNVFELFINSVCDSESNLLFTEADIPMLKKKSVVVIERIIEEINKLNGWTDKEELEKN